VEKILNSPRSKDLELAFVCDLLSPDAVRTSDMIPETCKTVDLSNFEKFGADLIVEVAHPSVTHEFGARILRTADFLLASTTAFADKVTERVLMQEAHAPSGKGLYVSVGALFGAQDIKNMSDSGKLHALTITMFKHPESYHPVEETNEYMMNERAKTKPYSKSELFRGPVREIAAKFPVNVNSMCTAALAAPNLGMDRTEAVLVADARMETMVIQVDILGLPKADGTAGLSISSRRENPSVIGEVTGPATLHSFYASVLSAAALGDQDGIHFV
jgi:predicted dinucleotide-utilizing enzyme